MWNSNPTATLALLAYQGITVGTHVSILEEAKRWPNLHCIILPQQSLIDRARSRIASMYLQRPRETAGDVLLFVDSDISWQPGDLSLIARRALEHKAIVCGVYPQRAFHSSVGMAFAPDSDGAWAIGADKLIPALYAGNGFVAIPRHIVRAVADSLPWVTEDGNPHGGFWPMFLSMVVETERFGDKRNEWLSEDWAFSYRAKALGFKLLVSFGPRLRHEGTYTYRLEDTLAAPPPDRQFIVTLHPSSSPALAGERTNSNGSFRTTSRLEV